MTNKIFRAICFVATGVLLAAILLFMGVLYGYFSELQLEQLASETRICAQGVEQSGATFFDALDTGDVRVTWVAADGSVLYDSKKDAETMENHAEREEIAEALEGGSGESIRYSDTLTTHNIYSAQRLTDGTVIRLSSEQRSFVTLILGMLQPIALILFVAVIAALLLASGLSRHITQPLNTLNLDDPLQNEGYDELAPLLRRIDMQQKQIRAQKEELRRRRREFETLTAGMHEGLVLLGKGGHILSINPAAAAVLGADADSVGMDMLTVCRLPAFAEFLARAERGERCRTVLTLAEHEYAFTADPVLLADEVLGVVLLIEDVTERADAEKMRREFTANVSHELKTPLQTISGCSELLANGIVKPEDVGTFGMQIHTEARRMITLVEDIIRLSHLDEGAEEVERERFDLWQTVSAVVRSLTETAERQGVTLTLRGETTEIDGVPQLCSLLVQNLCDNAIKYNREGGSVTVRVSAEGGYAVLSVADTGIGIPVSDRERVFERFYRVDKSRSKKVGGTGLGLSIVKHAAKLHDAEIELESTVDVGTTVTVRFPLVK